VTRTEERKGRIERLQAMAKLRLKFDERAKKRKKANQPPVND
jgi:hypothetical protein